MISKQERLQYGEILREQMREKERRKQLEDLEKRGAPRALQPQPQQYFPSQPPPPPPQMVMQPPLAYNLPAEPHYPQAQSPALDKKELLQKKLEMQEYNPFGRAGAGAPMRDQRGEIVANRKPVISQPNTAGYAQYEQVYAQQPYQQPPQQPYYGSQQNISAQHLDNQPYSPPPPTLQVPQVLTYSQPHQPPAQEAYQPSFVKQSPPVHVEQVFRTGGRNLLQMENVGMDQISLKQRQKLELQRALQQQIDQTARRKKQAEERERQIELKRQQDYNRQLEEEKKREEIEKRKKQQEEAMRQAALEQAQQSVAEANKKKKNLIQMPPIQVPHESAQPSGRQVAQSGPVPQENFVVQRQYAPSAVHSSLAVPDEVQENEDQIHAIEGAFDTDISRDFLRRQKEKHPERRDRDRELDAIRNRVQIMKEELSNKNEQHHNEMEKVRLEAERAKLEKQNAELELNRLKEELRRKIDDDNQRLNIALMKNDPSSYVPPSKIVQPVHQPAPLRSAPSERLVEKTYRVQEQNVNLSNNSGNFEVGLQSLVAESRKIPLKIQNTDKLTMSRIEDFAVDSRFFHKKSSNNVVQKRDDVIYEAEEDENNNAVPQDFGKYRPKSKRQDPFANEFAPDEELDRLVKGQAVKSSPKPTNKWQANLSSVDSEIGREIQAIMKNQRRAPSREDGQRPTTKLSNAGRNVLSDNKYGYAAQDFTLRSEEPGTVKGAYGTRNSFDLDHINQKNDRRLEHLRGVNSVVSGDGQLNRLDVILNNYH